MFNTKYVISRGLAFAENEEMEILSQYAKEGWILYKFGFLGYKLKKSKPEKLHYSLDYRTNPDKEYFSYFQEAGWHHVCSIKNIVHIFNAPEGVSPIYTDNDTEVEKYLAQYELTKGLALPSLLCSMLFIVLVSLAKYNYLPDIYRKIFGVLLIPAAVIAVISTIPCISYYKKINGIDKISTFSKKHKIVNKLSSIMFIILIALFLLMNFNIITINIMAFYLLCLITFLLTLSSCFIN